MASAIRKLFLGQAKNCSVCGKLSFCKHQDDELRSDICLRCLPYVALSEAFLRDEGFNTATDWDEN